MIELLKILAASLVAAGGTVWLCRSWYREGYIAGVRDASHANHVAEILDQPMPARPSEPLYPANAADIEREFGARGEIVRGPWGVA